MKENINIISDNNESRIAKVLDKQTNKILLEVEYNLNFKWIWDEKAKNMYGVWVDNGTEFFDNDKLLNSETFEVEIRNVSEIIELLLNNSEVEDKYNNDLEWLIHTHDNEEYRIMCNTNFLENKEVALNTFKTWLLLTTWLIYLDDFKEANTYIDENENWENNLLERYVIRI